MNEKCDVCDHDLSAVNDEHEFADEVLSYNHALLSIADLAKTSLPVSLQVLTAISFYTRLAYDAAPDHAVAEEIISAAVATGKTNHENNLKGMQA